MPEDWDDRTEVSREVAAADPAARTRARLIVLSGGNIGEMYEIAAESVLGRGREADVRMEGDGISRKHARVRATDGQIVLEDLGSTNGSYVNGARIASHALSEGDKIQIGTSLILKFTYQDELEEGFQRQMYESASRDALTDAYNKRFFMEQLQSEFSFATRHRSGLSLILLDIDDFTRVNETHGQAAGDCVLSELARRVTQAIRVEDSFARWGGAEFAVLSRCDSDAALAVAERLRQSVAQHSFVHMSTAIQVTVSVGIESLPNPGLTSVEAFVAAADRTLGAAKEGGRNRVVGGAAR